MNYFAGGVTMKVFHFYIGKEIVLSQFLANAPSVGEAIKIKGRKGKILQVSEIDDRTVAVMVELDKVKKRSTSSLNSKRKR
jgi:hypothetical protein